MIKYKYCIICGRHLRGARREVKSIENETGYCDSCWYSMYAHLIDSKGSEIIAREELEYVNKRLCKNPDLLFCIPWEACNKDDRT